MDSKRDRNVALVILLVSFAIFKLSPVHAIADSRYSMMFSQQLLWNHSSSLEAFAFPEFKSSRPINEWRRGVDYSYHLERWGDRFYYWFPPGSTILSMPYVALSNLVGISAVDDNGRYDLKNDTRIQVGLAALLMAVLAVITYFTSRMFLSLWWSVLVTTGATLGTSVWSIASRAMWIHTWGIFILAAVVWLIARAAVRQRRLHPVVLATCLSWLYFIRPSFAVSIIGVTIYVLIRHRRDFLPLILTGGAWLAAFLYYSYYHFGTLLPAYYEGQPHLISFGASFWNGLAGTLVSPGRGLLIYSPIVLFVGYLLMRYRSHLRKDLTLLAVGIACVHIMFMSAYLLWHGGHCYGARYCVDVVPWFALLGILAVEARLRWGAMNRESNSARRVRVEWTFALILLCCSIVLNGTGAVFWGPWYWNVHPSNIDDNRGRLWDWKNPPFCQLRKPTLNR